MSKVQNPITGRTKGQSAGMVFTTLYGSNVMKAKPFSYRDANTLVQRANRLLLANLTLLASLLKSYLPSLFYVRPDKMSLHSRIVQQFMLLYDRTSGSPVFVPNQKEIGSGFYESPIFGAEYNTNSGSLYVYWDPSALPADIISYSTVNVFVLDFLNFRLYGPLEDGNVLSDDGTTVLLPSGLSAEKLVCFISGTLQIQGETKWKSNIKRIFPISAV